MMPEVLPGPPDMVETQMIDARICDFDGRPSLSTVDLVPVN